MSTIVKNFKPVKLSNGVVFTGNKNYYYDKDNRTCEICIAHGSYFALYGYGMGTEQIKLSVVEEKDDR